MAGVWRKTMKYLGLVEEDDYEVEQRPSEQGERPLPVRSASSMSEHPGPVRRIHQPGIATATADEREAIVRTIPQARSSGTIHRAEPKRFNEARELGERFKDGIAVIVNLQGTDDAIARRLVDFASGLVFAHDGKIELVATRVYLLTPADVEVSAEERERIRGGGFYNQF
jgi:cell division inhibitor SepF